MHPAITNGALIRLTSTRNRAFRPGDVVLAVLGDGSCVVHRVRRVDGEVVQLQGDANLRSDSPVTGREVLAIVDLLCVQGRTSRIPAARIARARNALRAWRLRVSRRWARHDVGSAPPTGGALHAG
jgi:hypothetical protein